eukprot:TRINITY_DN9679_c0_g1_i1.p1 TRINITY_DN9679_c0_g1~~TRINITY_DN9679_c0_g1_i1.p1  ORF type:complete len:585 (-),score=94.10 TRINITY_DN9679_c0_g1_i1:120-1874(-)
MQRLCFILLCVVLYSTAQSTCRNNCTNHGLCVQSSCVCEDGWSGADCSVKQLKSGESVQDVSTARTWKYYSIANTNKGGAIRIDVVPVGLGGDCDTYVRRALLPTSTEYDKADTEWGSEAKIIIENADTSTYYIGVYANLLRCSFSIKATLTGKCTKGCVNGNCSTSGFCVCSPGWSGETCEQELESSQSLELDKNYNGHVDEWSWKYYYLNLTSVFPVVNINIEITDESVIGHDCDIYVKYNEIPTFLEWDYRDTSSNKTTVISMNSPSVGRWYIGFWGFQSCSFSMKISKSAESCISQCSRHGTCGPPCSCDTGYDGLYCQNKISPLNDGEEVSGFVAKSVFNYFTFTPKNAQQNVVIHVEQVPTTTAADTSCDVDLYVRRGHENPTIARFDYASVSVASVFDLVITDAVTQTLHIGVYGWFECGYKLKVTQTSTCPKGCEHGDCVDGTCICATGWAGVACDESETVLKPGVPVSGLMNVSATRWHYYNFNSTSHTVVISLKEKGPRSNNTGLLFLYANEDEAPTLTDYEEVDRDLNKGFHSIILNLDRRTDESIDWVIGVFGSPYVMEPIPYELVVWEPSK